MCDVNTLLKFPHPNAVDSVSVTQNYTGVLSGPVRVIALSYDKKKLHDLLLKNFFNCSSDRLSIPSSRNRYGALPSPFTQENQIPAFVRFLKKSTKGPDVSGII